MDDTRECMVCLDNNLDIENDFVIDDLLQDHTSTSPKGGLIEIVEMVNLYKVCSCKFFIHPECLLKWLETSPSCPLCHNELFIIDNISVRSTNSRETDTHPEAVQYPIPDIRIRGHVNNANLEPANNNTEPENNNEDSCIYNRCLRIITYLCCCFSQTVERNRVRDFQNIHVINQNQNINARNRNINARNRNINIRNQNINRPDIRVPGNVRTFNNAVYNNRHVNLANRRNMNRPRINERDGVQL